MKRTFQPSKLKRKRTHGFRARMSTRNGRKVLSRRRAKGRKSLTVCDAINTDFQVTLSSRRFTRTQRLTQGGDFKRMFTGSKRAGDEYFVVLGQNNQLALARLGLAIARKHIKTAVGRNRIKRLVRESFRQHQHALSGLDLVVMLRRDATGLTNQEIFRRLEKHWQHIRKLCDAS